MLDKIIFFSIRNKLIIGLLTLGLILWGVNGLRHLPIDAVPDITNNQVQVITVAPSQSALDIERLVTFPVEQNVATIPGIVEVRSFSRFGLSVVTIVFKDDIDVYWARQQVNERLTEIQNQIPPGVGSPKLAPITTGLGEIYQYVIHALPGYEEKYTSMELRTIQDWIVRRQLLGTPGVADVSSYGGYLKQYEIAINTDKLRSFNLSVTDIFSSLEKTTRIPGRLHRQEAQRLLHSFRGPGHQPRGSGDHCAQGNRIRSADISQRCSHRSVWKCYTVWSHDPQHRWRSYRRGRHDAERGQFIRGHQECQEPN